MPTQNRNPTSDISATGTWSGTAGTRYTLVDDYPTSTGDVLIHGTTAGNINFGYSAFSIPSIATNISVQVLYFDDRNGSASSNIGGRLRVGGTFYNATTHNPTNGVVVQRTDNWATNPRTGVAWTVNDINGIGSNALDAFGFISTDASPTVDIFSCQLQVTFDVAYRIVADNVIFNESGTFSPLRKGSRIFADVRSFILTRNDADLVKTVPAKVMTADVRSFALSGIAAGLAQAKRIIADTSSFAAVYNAAGLKAGRKIIASAGSFTGTYNAAGLEAGKKLSASTGSIALTGIQAGTKATRTITAAPASFIVTGYQVVFPNGKTVVAHTGAYSMALQDAGLRVTRKMAASAESFAFTGNAATLVYISPKSLSVDPGSFLLTRNAANLKVTRKLAADSGSFAYSGGSVVFNIIVDFRLYANNGHLGLVATDTALIRTHVFPADFGNILLTGQNTTLSLAKRIAVDAGEFALIGENIRFDYVDGRVVRVWNGNTWVEARMKVWDGSEWTGVLKMWDGTEWK